VVTWNKDHEITIQGTERVNVMEYTITPLMLEKKPPPTHTGIQHLAKRRRWFSDSNSRTRSSATCCKKSILLVM
jgi:hypothetical protein